MHTRPNPDWPESTYRLQFHAGFTFRDAAKIVPYLRDLGVTHCYASPYMKARPGSTHGYDVIDHHALNPEIGTEADYQAWLDAMREHGLQHVLDIVPNHVGVATNENHWWNDVLENGPASRYAAYFDIAWDASPRDELRGKVLLPLLGGLYAKVLESAELKLSFENGAFAVNYYDRRFPISPRTYPMILGHRAEGLESSLGKAELAEFRSVVSDAAALPDRAETEPFKQRLAALVDRSPALRRFIEDNVRRFNGEKGDPASFDLLDTLLDHQCYRLAYWKVAPDEINYRRFFDVNDLAALSMERQEVFDSTHELVFRLIREGKLQGLRIDHPDGLYDPKQYLRRLQESYAAAVPGADGRQLYVVVEKILALNEPLPAEWPVAGTSGYDFLDMVNGLYVKAGNAGAFSRLYEDFTGCRTGFADIVYEKKLLILRISLASELHTLARRLDRLAQNDRHSKDFTFSGIRDALAQVIACFPVYRSYISADGVGDADQRYVEEAVSAAIARNPGIEPEVFHFIRDMVLLRYPRSFDNESRQAQLQFVGKFQQLTSPVTAKGIEDTAFYIYNRLVSLNEVGGDPGNFGISAGALHEYLADRRAKWSRAMSPLSTHDTKRSEDVRARINVLSEMPEAWRGRVEQWQRLNAPHRTTVNGAPAPSANDEYLLYQTLVGAWPVQPPDDAGREEFVTRIQAYMQKAMREAKVHSSWIAPNGAYEDAVKGFVSRIIDPKTGGAFLAEFIGFQRTIGRCGFYNGLSQTLIRLAAPGVPDTYQGTELWDFSLVDPDNRRPVDYAQRSHLLTDLQSQIARAGADRAALAEELARHPEDGRVKLFVTALALEQRRLKPGLFSDGEYRPLIARGSRAEHVFAFAREHAGGVAVIVAPRLFSELVGSEARLPVGPDAWGDTVLELPGLDATASLANVFTGRKLMPSPSVALSEALAHFPIALFVSP